MHVGSLVFFVVSLLTQSAYADGLPSFIKGAVADQPIFVDVKEEKQVLLGQLNKEIAELAVHDEVVKNHIERTDLINKLIYDLERSFRSTRDPITGKSIAVLKETISVLKETVQIRENLRVFLQEYIKYLNEYLADPEFFSIKKIYTSSDKLYYTVDNEYQLYNDIGIQEGLISQLTDQEKNLQAEKNNRKISMQALHEERTRTLTELELISGSISNFDISEKRRTEEAIKFIDQLFVAKKEWEELRIIDVKRRLSFIQTRIFVEKMRLEQMRKILKSMKAAVKVTEVDVLYDRELLEQEKKEYLLKKEQIQHEREAILVSQKEQEAKLDQLSKEKNITLGKDLDDWMREPRNTMQSYLAVAEVGTINAYVLLLKRELEKSQAAITLEDEKFNFRSVKSKAKESYYRISERKFFSEEDITQEIESYKIQKTEVANTISHYKERLNALADQLGQQKKIVDTIKAWRDGFIRQQELLFSDYAKESETILLYIKQAQEYLQGRIDVLGQMTGIYSSIIAEANNSVRMIDFIMNELQTITIWYRPEYAITLHGVQNIGNDVGLLFTELGVYLSKQTIESLTRRLGMPFKGKVATFLLFGKLFLFILALYILRRYLPLFSRMFLSLGKKSQGLLRFINLVATLIINFITNYFGLISLWLSAAFLLYVTVRDPYVYALFYLASIPYLIYLTHRFIRTLIQFNMHYDYALMATDFQGRFVFLVSTLLYATIGIFFFRQAFLLISQYRSELPTILLAVNFIILQISLIFLISKEQILSILPTKNSIWLWARTQVDRYFYLILFIVIAIIIMSNPYIGFGRLVLYIASNLIYTAFVIKAVIWMHGFFKRGASYIFFFSGEDVIRERFTYARTWFGLFIISSFFIFSFIGIIIVAKIWGWPIFLKDIIALFHHPILLEQTTTPISLSSLLQIIGFVMGGFVAAYAIDRFVLDKIFDLLLVDAGVQHATVRLIQYFFVVIAVAMGLKSVGLDALIGWVIGGALLGIGWYVRELLADFIAYFIILIQRPIKIGDYIKMEEETQGVVQRITARSIVIRRKNSTTIVIPNSQVVSRPVINWNYVRNFIAFDDIDVFIDYREDPDVVKELLLQAVTSHQQVLRNPKPIIRLDAFEVQGYRFMVRGFVSSVYTLEMWNIASDVRLSIMRSLRANNIRVALPLRIITKDHDSKMRNVSIDQ